MPEPVRSYYAPPERSSEELLQRQIKIIDETPLIKILFDSVPAYVAILNMNREIVFANKTFLRFFTANNLLSFLGKRPGEAINCLHSSECMGGCGTSEACSVCGAVNAILISQKSGASQSECRIMIEDSDPLDLLVITNQYKTGGEEFTIFAATDISDTNRRKALERIFFHDLLNITGALKGFLEIMKDAPQTEREEYINFSRNITEHLIEEILSQKELSLAEDNELHLTITPFSSLDLLKEISVLYEKHIICMGKNILVDKNSTDIVMTSDKTILRRVLGNLTKNALEAIREGDNVVLSCRGNERQIEFSIHNKGFIPRPVQLQIFQRSFSTKGKGRGLGTYSVKLLTEKYLAGEAYFTTDENDGTTFYVRFPVVL